MANADNVRKLVLGQLVDTRTRSFYAFDLMRDAVEGGFTDADTVDLPTQAKPTSRSATTRAVPEAISPSANKLFVNEELFYNIDVQKKSNLQLMQGSWLANTSQDAAFSMLNDRDDNLCAYVARDLAWDAAAAGASGVHGFIVNGAADPVSADDLSLAEAIMRSQDGAQDLVWLLNPYFAGSVKTLADPYVSSEKVDPGMVGIPRIGSINGIAAFSTNAVPRRFTVDCSAVTVASNVATITVPAGHGIPKGAPISSTGLTTELDPGATVLSTAATEITAALTASNGALADGEGTLTIDVAYGLLVDRRKVFKAEANDVDIEIVSDYESGKRALQVHHLFGRKGIAGAAVAVLSPGSSI